MAGLLAAHSAQRETKPITRGARLDELSILTVAQKLKRC